MRCVDAICMTNEAALSTPFAGWIEGNTSSTRAGADDRGCGNQVFTVFNDGYIMNETIMII